MLRWVRLAYDWYHFAIAQETSELAYIEITRILCGQPRGPATMAAR